jgi:hypothetical protein
MPTFFYFHSENGRAPITISRNDFRRSSTDRGSASKEVKYIHTPEKESSPTVGNVVATVAFLTVIVIFSKMFAAAGDQHRYR